MRIRLFSDAGLIEEEASWGALALVGVGGLWRLAAAAGARLPEGTTVPAAEMHAAAQAWLMERLVRVRATVQATETDRPATGLSHEPGGRGLASLEIFKLEFCVNLGWAEGQRSEVANEAGVGPRP